jgi:hypothetical protein
MGRFPAGTGFFLFHSVQTGSGANPASYAMGTGGSFLGPEAEAKNGEATPQLPHTS